MPRGIVQEYDQQRGHGRIIDCATSEPLNVYANYVDCEFGQTLMAGQTVEYEIEYHRGENNWAVYVRIVAP